MHSRKKNNLLPITGRSDAVDRLIGIVCTVLAVGFCWLTEMHMGPTIIGHHSSSVWGPSALIGRAAGGASSMKQDESVGVLVCWCAI